MSLSNYCCGFGFGFGISFDAPLAHCSFIMKLVIEFPLHKCYGRLFGTTETPSSQNRKIHLFSCNIAAVTSSADSISHES
jgi:hypothetical protein